MVMVVVVEVIQEISFVLVLLDWDVKVENWDEMVVFDEVKIVDWDFVDLVEV